MPAAPTTPPQGSRARTYGLLLATTLFWGGTAVAGKLVIRGIPPFTVGIFRYGIAGAVLAVAFRRQLPGLRSLRRSDLWLLLWAGILGITLNHVFFFLGLVFAPAAHGAIIPPTISPILTMLLAARLGRERVTQRQVAGILVCLVGVVLVVRPDRLAGGSGTSTLLGDLLFVVGGTAWGVYSYLSKVAMLRFSAVGTLVCAMGIGTVLLLPLALAERPWNALHEAQSQAWGALGYLTVAGSLLSFLWWNVGIRHLGAGRTAVFTNLVPLFGVLLAWLVLGERLTPLQLAGGLLAVGGVVVCQASPAGAAPPRYAPGGGRGQRR
jgi:drug/metabolite transporter (DMT)-like permease